MDVRSFFKEYDSFVKTKTDKELENLLKETCLLHEVEEPDDKQGCGALYNELGSFYRARHRMEEGEYAFLEAKKALEVSNEPTTCSTGCSNCGVKLSFDNKKNLTETIDYATILNNLAGLYRMWQKTDIALELFKQAIDLYDRLPQATAELIASNHNNMGLVYLDLKDGEQAEVSFRKALSTIEGVEYNHWMIGTTLSNLAFAYLTMRDFSRAVDNFREAAQYFQQTGEENREMVDSCLAMAENLEQLK